MKNRRDFIINTVITGSALGLIGTSTTAVGLTREKYETPSESGNKLFFNKNGKFKIVQFTDTHWNPAVRESEEALENMNNVLDIEKTDLVFYTGDNVTENPTRKALDKVFEPVLKDNLPFALVLGNHDDEYDMNRKEIFEYVKKMPGNMTSIVNGISGITNFTIPLYRSDSEKIVTVLYGLDSDQDTVEADQVEWYNKKSREFAQNNKGIPVPSLAFFHIPIPEFKEAIVDFDACFYGTRKEHVCCSDRNTGLFSAFKRNGDVMGVIVGHDHLNDYVICWKDIMLCYGRVSGSRKTTYYNHPDGGSGARVIELNEKGPHTFQSWIRLRTGEMLKPFKYPVDFID